MISAIPRIKSLVHLSWRNLFRHRRRTLITLMSIAFGASLALVYIGIRESNYTTFVHHAARMNFGHLSILPPKFLESTSSTNYLHNCNNLEKMVLKTVPSARVVQRIMAEGVLASGDRSEGIVVLGVSPEKESSETLLFLENQMTGNSVAGDSSEPLNLGGKTLIENLNTSFEERLVLHTQTQRAQVTSTLTTITKAFETGNDQLDARLLVLDLEQSRQIFEYQPDECSFIGIFLDDANKVAETAAQLKLEAGLGAEGKIYTWEEVNPDLVSYIALDRVLYRVILGFVILIIGCGILATVMMNAQERRKEVGILLAIGMKPFEVFFCTLVESTALSTFGTLLGFICSAPVVYYLHNYGLDFSSLLQSKINAGGVVVNLILHCTVTPNIAFIVFGLIFTVTFLFSVYPAVRLAFTQPIDVLENR